MARIEVTLTEDDIRAACMDWAVTRVLNEGQAVSCDLSITTCHGVPIGTINSARVLVETERMSKPLPKHISQGEQPA